MNASSKKDREKCWDCRDKYWSCLDMNDDNVDKCIRLRKEFEKHCSQQWVKHFDRKRKYEVFKSKLDETNWTLPNEKQ